MIISNLLKWKDYMLSMLRSTVLRSDWVYEEIISLNLEDEATPLVLSWSHAPGGTQYIFHIYIFNLMESKNKTLSNIFIKEEI